MKRIRTAYFVALIAAVLSSITFEGISGEISQDRIDRWEPTIRGFERRDAEAPPTAGGVVFVGSSSIRRWDLTKWFGDATLNRGFGGSQIIDATHFVDRLVLKHKPRMVIFYAGDNDIAASVSAGEVAKRFARFNEVVHAELPKTKMVFIAIKPSPRRWHLAEQQKAANDLIRRQCDVDELLTFLDVWTPMIGDDGQPKRELFVKDMLHLNDEGYKLWTDLVKPLLAE